MAKEHLKRVLIVDDDDDFRSWMKVVLEGAAYSVLEASSGPEGLSLLDEHSVRLALVDWMMPGITGPDWCRQVRKRGEYVYVLMVTALSGKGNYLAGIEAGADDFLTKPVDHEVVLARLAVAERILDVRHKLELIGEYIPICSHCLSIRTENESWRRLDHYLTEHGGPHFTPRDLSKLLREALPALGSGSTASTQPSVVAAWRL